MDQYKLRVVAGIWFVILVILMPIYVLHSISASFGPFIENLSWWIFIPVIVISTWTLVLTAYYIFLATFGFGKAKRDYTLKAPKTRFLIMIPAHNEAQVIAATLDNLSQMTYPQDKYKIVVVSDNSSDDTTKIGRDLGYLVVDTSAGTYERHGVGKPAGLQYALDYLKVHDDLSQYDMVMVLDADNFVAPNILTELDSQYQAKHFTAIQAYLDSKNYQAFLSLGYAASYWTMNRFFQLSKYRLGLDNSIGGTGYVVETKWLLANNGFRSSSLTEDLEMEIRIVRSGGTVGWNHFTRIYDEKPEHIRASMVQRYRWSKGHWYTAFHNLGPLLKGFFKSGDVRYLDQISYLFSMRQNFQLLLALLFFIFWLVASLTPQLLAPVLVVELGDVAQSYFIPVTIVNWVILLEGFLPMIAGYLYDAKIHTHRKLLLLPWTVLAMYWFSLTYLLDQIAGLLTFGKQGSWSHTNHNLTMMRAK
ncbi:MAG: glycosyltransferase family 2 protein [Lactobacillus sp.]|jgi:cellulose synthase/poly-beta-1,6-N-acetylglucosamine synthase-like glycosyltransferase|nr:glycosyltransferase family 2 protein [Lactobacillus sp.]